MRRKTMRITGLFFLVFSAAAWDGRAISAEGSWESEFVAQPVSRRRPPPAECLDVPASTRSHRQVWRGQGH